MEAFNVPYCGFNPSQAIGNIQFIATSSIRLSTGNQTHAINNDLCLCDLYTWNTGDTYSPPYYLRYAVTLLKDDTTPISFILDKVSFTRNNNTITVRNTSGNYGVATFYDFDFA